MTQNVRVRKCNDDGTAEVFCLRESACSGDCHKCAGCGAVKQTVQVTARNPIGAKPGDSVVIQSDTGPVLKAAAVLYLLPLVLFFLGYGLGSLAGAGALGGCLAFALGIAGAVAYDRLVAKKQKSVYTIIGFLPAGGEARGEGEEH